ncbi:kinase-like protein [Auricularia subglabra TFB-10046 SS5]|nr:kinase-like protein [Auricularia subglabra TFB-10046 SS5]
MPVSIRRLGGALYDVQQRVLADGEGGLLLVAVMTIRDDARNTRQHLLHRSAAALDLISHENVERALQTGISTHDHCFVTLWPDGGDLRMYLVANPTADGLVIGLGIAGAVLHLHTMTPHAVIHGNLDLSTIFMHGDTPRLWDFALCRLIPAPAASLLSPPAPVVGELDGAITSMAPELHESRLCTTASDVYAFGMLLFEMCARRRPFPTMSRTAAAAALYSGQRPPRAAIPHGPRNDAVWAIITSCWAPNAAARPSMAQVHSSLAQLV